MLIVWFLSIKSLPNLLFSVLCLPGDQSHPFVQPSINPLACCICWAGLLGRAVFPPWNEGPNFESYSGLYLLSSVWKFVFPLTCGVCPQWVGLDQYLLKASRKGGFCVCFGEWSWMLSLWRSVSYSVVCFEMYVFGIILGTLSTNAWYCVPILASCLNWHVWYWSLLTFM